MDIQLLLVPYDSGQRGWRCGAGPEHLVRAGLPAHLQRQGHIVTAIHIIEDDPAYRPAEIRTAFELARRLATTVRSARIAGHFPLVLSGNCNTAVGTLCGLTPARRATFWFDAHGDCNTPETTTSGFLDGMGLAMTMGLCWHHLVATVPGFQPVAAEATFLMGARDLIRQRRRFCGNRPLLPSQSVRSRRGPRASWRGRRWQIPSAISTWTSMCWIRPSAARTTCRPPTASPFPDPTAAIVVVRARVPLGAAALTSYSPEDDHDQGVSRAAFAAIDAIVANGA